MDIFELVKCNDFGQIINTEWSEDILNSFGPEGLTPLMTAAGLGYVDTVLALKNKGADLHITDKNGKKAVDYAAFNGHGLVLINLIEGGCGG